MDYRIRRESADLESTGFMEIGPGKYANKHWQKGFLFVWEDAFVMAEGILQRHFPEYDHLSMNDIPKETGLRVIKDWREAAKLLPSLKPEEAFQKLNMPKFWAEGFEAEYLAHREQIAEMFGDLADSFEKLFLQDEWVCILGV